MNNPYATAQSTIKEFSFEQLSDIEENLQSNENFKNYLLHHLMKLRQTHNNMLNQGLSSNDFNKHSTWLNAIDAATNIINTIGGNK